MQNRESYGRPRALRSYSQIKAGAKKRALMLAEIYDWFTEGFDTADLKEAKQPHPDQPIDGAQPQTARPLTIEDRDLMTKGDEFRVSNAARLQIRQATQESSVEMSASMLATLRTAEFLKAAAIQQGVVQIKEKCPHRLHLQLAS